MKELELHQWQAQNLRLTVFSVEDVLPIDKLESQASKIWESLIDSPPNEVNIHPKERRAVIEEPIGGENLRLDVEGSKITWFEYPFFDTETQDLPLLGSYDETQSNFRDRMTSWLSESCPNINRIAYGAGLVLPKENRISVYEALNDLIPSVNLDVQQSRDFIYRINRQRHSSIGIQGLRLNRLSTWSGVEFKTVTNNPEGTNEKVAFAGLVNMDINTIKESAQVFEKLQVLRIFEELVSNANEIAKRGDQP